MDRASLERLSRAELIELVVRMTEMIALLGRLEERIPELEGRLADHGAEAAERVTLPKTSENSSVPPSMGFKANRPERRARKRRRGHLLASAAPSWTIRTPCRPS